MSRPARSAVALALALLVGLGGAASWTVRARRASWARRADQICACSTETVSRLRRGANVSPEDLGAVMIAQARILDATCGDLRRATRDQGALDALRDKALRVAPTIEHDRATADVRATLRRLCDPARDAVWARAPEREPGGTVWSQEIVRAAGEARRLRGALCARQALLASEPEVYALTPAQADEEARTCGQPPR